MVNALTPLHHPCQALADLMTLRERFGDLDGQRLAYVGDGNNVARSLAIVGELAGVEVVVAAPPGYQLEEGHGAKLTADPRAAADGADALYTDVWVSMGDEAEAERRRADLAPFRLDGDLLARGQGGRHRPPLPARPSGRGDQRRRPLRRLLGGMGPGGEPPARPEGAAGGAARRLGAPPLGAMYPHLEIGPVTLQTFGLMFALAFLAAGALIWRRLGEIGKPVDWAYEMGFAALLGGIVGSRVYFLVQNYSEVKDDLLGNLFSGAGLVWYGGAIGGALAVLAWAWYRDFLGLALLDLAAPALALGYAIGRCGCQLSGDGDYGKAWNGPWAMSYPDGTVPTEQTVHPTPIYETLAMGLGAWILWQLRDRVRAGVLFALYLLYAGAERFLVEFLRRNDASTLGLTSAQLESLGMMIAGAIWIAVVVRRHGGISRPGTADTAQVAI